MTGAPADRAAVRAHDIGLMLKQNGAGELGFEVLVGGGLGRTPMIGKTVREFLPADELLAYCTAIMRVYNRFGRRDNKYKARVKILVHELGLRRVQARGRDRVCRRRPCRGHRARGRGARAASRPTSRRRPTSACPTAMPLHDQRLFAVAEFGRWVRNNTARHKVPGYAIVNVSLKPIGGIPGDATSEQMRAVAALADEFSHGEIRVTHEQNLVLPNVRSATCSRSGTCSRMRGSPRPTAT